MVEAACGFQVFAKPPAGAVCNLDCTYIDCNGDLYSCYDVAPDGRFIIRMEPTDRSTHLVVVENWFEELKRLVPAN